MAQSEAQRRWVERNRDKIAAYRKGRNAGWMRAWREKNPKRYQETLRRANLKRNFNITPEIYRALEIAQQGECAICGQPERAKWNDGRTRRLAVDHNHQTGRVRGLLCNSCNRGMGYLSDDPAHLRQAATYLELALD